MRADLLLWAMADAILEHAVTNMWDGRNDALVDTESDDWFARLGEWRMTWLNQLEDA